MIYLFDNFYWKRRNLPPGPAPLPFFGNVYAFMNNKTENSIKEWHKKYGDIMTIWLGTLPVVTIHDSPTIYATFLKDGENYTGRYLTKGGEVTRDGRNGVIFTEGQLWREHRRFAIQVLKDFGLGKNLMQERILDEVRHTIAGIKEDVNNGVKMVTIQKELDRAVGSIINLLLFGYRFGRENVIDFETNKQNINSLLKNATWIWWMIMEQKVDFMKNLPFFNKVYEKVKNDGERIAEFYIKQIKIHKKKIDFDSHQEPTDY
uniref:Cytochrome P450 n=1 Tax=Panagrolaimus sp. JU765 TaxID=591449 RepID=A0AC34QCK5_9BILA